MAAVPVTIVGILTTETGASTNATLIGMASLTGLGVGGGPVEPPTIWPSPGHPAHPIAPGGPPPSVWPGPERPAHPIVLPDPPQVPPPTVWPPGPGIDVPAHPIVLPNPPGSEIPPGTLITWKPVWTPDRGWMVIGVPNVPHPAPA